MEVDGIVELLKKKSVKSLTEMQGVRGEIGNSERMWTEWDKLNIEKGMVRGEVRRNKEGEIRRGEMKK